MGREELPFRHQEDQPMKTEDITGSDTYQSWCNVCVRARGRENRHEARSQVQSSTPDIQCDDCFLKTEEDAPMITVLVAMDTVFKQMVAIPLEKKKKGQQRSIRKSQSGRIRTSQSDHPRRLRARTHGSHPRRMRTTDSRNHEPHL